MQIKGGLSKVLERVRGNKLIVFFLVTHSIFVVFLGRLFALAPDEVGYMYTFNNVYTLPIAPRHNRAADGLQLQQYFSGSPTYLPKFLICSGFPTFFLSAFFQYFSHQLACIYC